MADVDLLKYPMNHTYRGIALIFAYRNFSAEQNFAERRETNLDCAQMEMRLKKCGFDVITLTTYGNKKYKLTKEGTLSCIDKILESHGGAEGRLEKSDCFIAVFMSYGADGIIFAQDTHMMFYEDILDKFNGIKCPALVGKPKLFIVQASPVRYAEVADGSEPTTLLREKYSIPSEANTLIVWNPLPGYFPQKMSPKEKGEMETTQDHKEGSLFIQSVCENLREHSETLSVPTVIRKAVKEVCHVMENNNLLPVYEYKIPYVINMLTKEFTLTPKKKR